MSNAVASPSNSKQNQNQLDVDKILSREASALQREVEVERILKAFKLKYVILCHFFSGCWPWRLFFFSQISPYDVLDLKETATAEDIKKKFRQISLCALFVLHHDY